MHVLSVNFGCEKIAILIATERPLMIVTHTHKNIVMSMPQLRKAMYSDVKFVRFITLVLDIFII